MFDLHSASSSPSGSPRDQSLPPRSLQLMLQLLHQSNRTHRRSRGAALLRCQGRGVARPPAEFVFRGGRINHYFDRPGGALGSAPATGFSAIQLSSISSRLLGSIVRAEPDARCISDSGRLLHDRSRQGVRHSEHQSRHWSIHGDSDPDEAAGHLVGLGRQVFETLMELDETSPSSDLGWVTWVLQWLEARPAPHLWEEPLPVTRQSGTGASHRRSAGDCSREFLRPVNVPEGSVANGWDLVGGSCVVAAKSTLRSLPAGCAPLMSRWAAQITLSLEGQRSQIANSCSVIEPVHSGGEAPSWLVGCRTEQSCEPSGRVQRTPKVAGLHQLQGSGPLRRLPAAGSAPEHEAAIPASVARGSKPCPA